MWMNRPAPVSIPSRGGTLEAMFSLPACPPRAAALILHPHPLYQGTMDNKVVTTLARSADRLGAASLRFNFRGVGRSSGSYDGGRGEKDDARDAARWLRNRLPDPPFWLMGFSFGAALAVDLAEELGASFLVTVAPPPAMVGRQTPPPCPWLLVQGDADEVVDPKAVRSWAQAFSPPPHLVILPGATHFFHGRLTSLLEAVLAEARRLGLATEDPR